MREIKFKFWLGHTGKMTYAHSLSEVSKIIPDFTNDIMPLQYTGLKDKNGVEIYEGDLIKSKFIGEKPLEVVYDEDFGAFKMAQDGYYMGFMGDKNRHELEVVGNIYQNPELL